MSRQFGKDYKGKGKTTLIKVSLVKKKKNVNLRMSSLNEEFSEKQV